MAGYHDLEPHTRETLVSEYMSRNPGLVLVRRFDPDDPLEPWFQDAAGKVTTLSGAPVANGANPAREGEISASIYPAKSTLMWVLAIAALVYAVVR